MRLQLSYVGLALISSAGSLGGTAFSQAPAQTAPATIDVLRQQGMAAVQKGDNAGALRIFRQVLALDPADVVAYNISGVTSTRLKDYPAAIDYFKHALALRPDEYHNLAGLIRAYTLSGRNAERDELRKHIEELATAGKLPPTFSYEFETFDAAGKQVQVFEFPKVQGIYGERYRFEVFDATGTEVYCVTLESGQFEQEPWAKDHPKESAAGLRQFSLDGYSVMDHSTFAFYNGEPPYEQVREEARQVMADKKQPISKSVFSSPQPIPGAN